MTAARLTFPAFIAVSALLIAFGLVQAERHFAQQDRINQENATWIR